MIKDTIYSFKILVGFIFPMLHADICNGQYDNYARQIVDSLGSPLYKGRGYVFNGEWKAANFIQKEFKNLGMRSINNSYFQNFHVPVNIINGKVNFKVDNLILEPGKDYLISPESPSVNGMFKLLHINEDDLTDQKKVTSILKKSKDKFICIWPSENKLSNNEKNLVQKNIKNIKYNQDHSCQGFVSVTNNKLTWYGATKRAVIPEVIIRSQNINPKSKSINIQIESEYIEKYQTQNVIGLIKGKRYPDSVIVLTAHYDHLGMMGEEVYFPGANDNASGVAMLLSLAKHFSIQENSPDFSILFIAFGAEEIGLLGAKFYSENPLLPLENIKFLLNFDLAGTGDKGIKVVNGSVYKNEFQRLKLLNQENNYLKAVQSRGEACNSDHCMFYNENVPCFYIYTLGGIKAYHDIYDRPETLPLSAFNGYFELLKDYISGF